MTKLLSLLFSVLLFASCQQHPSSASVNSTSPDGKATIHVKAKKQVSLDPFTVNMEVTTTGISQGSLTFEISASVIDSTDLKFDWKDKDNCIITFVQSDNEQRIFRYYATSTNVVLQEVKKD